MVSWIVRLEGLAVFLLSLYFYSLLNQSWIIYLIFILTPDIGMIGYLNDKRLGSFTYNFTHNYILAIAFILLGLSMNIILITGLGLILASHIGIDRFFGYGLKYKTNFKDTHIQRI